MFCKSTCRPSDPATDSVRVDLAAIASEKAAAEEEAFLRAQEEERAAREREAQLERERAEREEQERIRREEEEKEAERRRLEELRAQEEERLRLEEQARLAKEEEEKARRKREEQERREEAARQARLKEEQERKEEVAAFCKRHRFADATAPRQSGWGPLASSTTYPLHVAAELADLRMVQMLIKEGVDVQQKNSAGKTAAQVAQKKDKKGSHVDVRNLLGRAAMPRSGGA